MEREPCRAAPRCGTVDGMGTTPDLHPAARRLGALVRRVDDSALEHPTPCEGRTVSQLLGHLHGLTAAFRASGDKELGPLTDTSPDTDGWPDAPPGWRAELPARADRLAATWQRPEAWTGLTRAGGVELPAEVMGVVALGELTLHAWDLAVATGQDLDLDEPTAEALEAHLEEFDPAGTPGMFGPAVPTAPDASRLDRIVARTGRSPGWQPPGPG